MHRASLAPCPAAFASGRRPPPVVRLVLLHRGTAASSWQQIVAAPGGSADSQIRARRQTPRSARGQQEGPRCQSLGRDAAQQSAPGAVHNTNALCHSAPRKREPSKNTGRRTRCRALEACGGSAELSLRRPLGAAPCFSRPRCSREFGAIARSKRSPSAKTARDTAPAKVGSNAAAAGSP